MLPNSEIIKTLIEAYNPCQFFDKCKEAKWNPEGGFIPRGFLGATGELEEVEAVFVFAEPGHPMPDEHGEYSESLSPEEYIQLTTDFAYVCFSREVDEMHVNVRYILNEIWPSLSFEEQLKKVWMTETRLCSIKKEIGNIPIRNRDICSSHYLKKQLNLFTNAKVIGFGNKAKDTLTRLGQDHLGAWAVSPPGANNQKAKDSWENVIHLMRNKDNVKVSISIESSGETVSNQDIVEAGKKMKPPFYLRAGVEFVKPMNPPEPFGRKMFVEINHKTKMFGFSFKEDDKEKNSKQNRDSAKKVLSDLEYKAKHNTKPSSDYYLIMAEHNLDSALDIAKAFKELVDKAGEVFGRK